MPRAKKQTAEERRAAARERTRRNRIGKDRSMEIARDNITRKKRREDPEYRKKEQEKNNESRLKRRQNPEYRKLEQKKNTEAHAKRRKDPEYRKREQQRNTENRRKRRLDPVYREKERQRDRELRKKRRQNPEIKAAEQEVNTLQRILRRLNNENANSAKKRKRSKTGDEIDLPKKKRGAKVTIDTEPQEEEVKIKAYILPDPFDFEDSKFELTPGDKQILDIVSTVANEQEKDQQDVVVQYVDEENVPDDPEDENSIALPKDILRDEVIEKELRDLVEEERIQSIVQELTRDLDDSDRFMALELNKDLTQNSKQENVINKRPIRENVKRKEFDISDTDEGNFDGDDRDEDYHVDEDVDDYESDEEMVIVKIESDEEQLNRKKDESTKVEKMFEQIFKKNVENILEKGVDDDCFDDDDDDDDDEEEEVEMLVRIESTDECKDNNNSENNVEKVVEENTEINLEKKDDNKAEEKSNNKREHKTHKKEEKKTKNKDDKKVKKMKHKEKEKKNASKKLKKDSKKHVKNKNKDAALETTTSKFATNDDFDELENMPLNLRLKLKLKRDKKTNQFRVCNSEKLNKKQPQVERNCEVEKESKTPEIVQAPMEIVHQIEKHLNTDIEIEEIIQFDIEERYEKDYSVEQETEEFYDVSEEQTAKGEDDEIVEEYVVNLDDVHEAEDKEVDESVHEAGDEEEIVYHVAHHNESEDVAEEEEEAKEEITSDTLKKPDHIATTSIKNEDDNNIANSAKKSKSAQMFAKRMNRLSIFPREFAKMKNPNQLLINDAVQNVNPEFTHAFNESNLEKSQKLVVENANLNNDEEVPTQHDSSERVSERPTAEIVSEQSFASENEGSKEEHHIHNYSMEDHHYTLLTPSDEFPLQQKLYSVPSFDDISASTPQPNQHMKVRNCRVLLHRVTSVQNNNDLDENEHEFQIPRRPSSIMKENCFRARNWKNRSYPRDVFFGANLQEVMINEHLTPEESLQYYQDH